MLLFSIEVQSKVPFKRNYLGVYTLDLGVSISQIQSPCANYFILFQYLLCNLAQSSALNYIHINLCTFPDYLG